MQDRKSPLKLVDMPKPTPGPGDVLIEISVCGVCHTDLHTLEGVLTFGVIIVTLLIVPELLEWSIDLQVLNRAFPEQSAR